MTKCLVIKQGDTARLWSDVLEVGGTAIDLAGATVKLRYRLLPAGNVVERPATPDLTKLGKVTYQPIAEDVAVAGQFDLQWLVRFGTGQQITVPSDGSVQMRIDPDLALVTSVPGATSFSDLYDTMRALLGDRRVHGVWHYPDPVLLSALRSIFIMGRQPSGYQLAGDNPFVAVALQPAIKLGDDAALLIYDACLALVAGEDGAMSFTTRSLSVNDKGDRKADLLWEFRAKIDDIRGGTAVWSTLQTFAQFVTALPHERHELGFLRQAIGQSSIEVTNPLGDIVI